MNDNDHIGERYAAALLQGSISIDDEDGDKLIEDSQYIIKEFAAKAQAAGIPPRLAVATLAVQIGVSLGIDTMRSAEAPAEITAEEKFNEGWAGLARFVESARMLTGKQMYGALSATAERAA